ncbi:MAG: class I SAM-dependent methyltransferase [Candidatus Aminicenantia bacterium]
MTSSKKYFAKVAKKWDEIRAGYFTEEVREIAIAKADLSSEMIVADVGTGTGFIAIGLAPLVKKVYCIDNSPEMLKVAKRNLRKFKNIELKLADGQNIPLQDERLDAVFANMYLHHSPDPLAAIKEMMRILKPGGRLIITDADKHNYEWMREEMADIWLGFDREQIKTWFSQAGLKEIRVDCTGSDCCSASHTGEKVAISIFVATGIK